MPHPSGLDSTNNIAMQDKQPTRLAFVVIVAVIVNYDPRDACHVGPVCSALKVRRRLDLSHHPTCGFSES